VIGLRYFGPCGQSWIVFRIPGLIAPVAGLTSLSGFVRALYVRSLGDRSL